MFAKEDILNYVMTTPENVNKQVLGYMLDDLEGGEHGSSSIKVLKEIKTDHQTSNGAFEKLLTTVEIENYEVSSDFTHYLIIIESNQNSGFRKSYNYACYSRSDNKIYTTSIVEGNDSIDTTILQGKYGAYVTDPSRLYNKTLRITISGKTYSSKIEQTSVDGELLITVYEIEIQK